MLRKGYAFFFGTLLISISNRTRENNMCFLSNPVAELDWTCQKALLISKVSHALNLASTHLQILVLISYFRKQVVSISSNLLMLSKLYTCYTDITLELGSYIKFIHQYVSIRIHSIHCCTSVSYMIFSGFHNTLDWQFVKISDSNLQQNNIT